MDFYVNKRAQTNGDHEVHERTCAYLPLVENRLYLGNFSNCRDAVTEARKTYSTADGCKWCSPSCHNQ